MTPMPTMPSCLGQQAEVRSRHRLGYSDPILLLKIALDLDADLEMRNGALNGLRGARAKDFNEVTIASATSSSFEDDSRA